MFAGRFVAGREMVCYLLLLMSYHLFFIEIPVKSRTTKIQNIRQ